MNTKEAARAWQVSERTVQSWCKHGWTESAKCDTGKRVWKIEIDAAKPLIFSEKKQESHSQRLALILIALSKRKTIPPGKLHCDRDSLQEHFNQLSIAGLIEERNVQSQDMFQCYSASMKGDEFLANRKGILKIARDLIPILAPIAQLAVTIAQGK